MLFVYETWVFGQTTNKMLRETVWTFFRLKLLSSPFPKDVQTKQDKIEYVRHLNEYLESDLKVEEFKPNPSLRSVAKLACVSL